MHRLALGICLLAAIPLTVRADFTPRIVQRLPDGTLSTTAVQARLGEPVATRVGFLLSVVIGVVVSLMLSLVVEGKPDGKVMNTLNPVVGLVNFIDRSSSSLDASLVFLGAMALLAVFLAAVVLHGRDAVRSV